MQKAWLVAWILVAGILAGCSGKSSTTTSSAPTVDLSVLSPAIYKEKPPVEVWVPSSVDGKRMNNALYMPDVPAGVKVPVYINFSPYHGDGAMKKDDAFAHYMIDEYVPRGYAVVLSSVRGTGHSEGCFQIGGDLELKDTYDVVDYFSKQPWSNGNVGAGAKSYDATSQNGMIAKFPHPALKTIFHVSGITDMYRYNGKDGVTYSNGVIFNTDYGAGQGLSEYGGPGAGAGGTGDDTPQSYARLVDDLACPELAKENSSGVGTAGSGLKDAYWQERDWNKFLPASKWDGSIFFVHGLQDWNVKPDNIDPWVDIVQQKGIAIKGWLHQETDNGGHLYPMRTDWNVTMLRWLDHYLKGKDTGIEKELGFDVMGSDKVWRRSDTWPPAGQSTATPLTQMTTVAFPMATDTRVAGVPYLKVTATTMSADPVLHATIYDKDASGKQTWVGEAIRRGDLSDDLTTPAPWPPGSARSFNLTFYPLDHEFLAGHSLVIELGFPAGVTTGGSSDNTGFVITPDQTQVTYTAATLGYKVVPPGGELAPQPAHMKCFTC